MNNLLASAATAVLILSAAAVGADTDVPQFQLIIRQSAEGVSGLNAAFGHGENIQFFSNLDHMDVEWQSNEEGVRTGIITGDSPRHVVLGVCAGTGQCSVSGDLSFTSSLAPPP